jgi:hypothetical protein
MLFFRPEAQASLDLALCPVPNAEFCRFTEKVLSPNEEKCANQILDSYQKVLDKVGNLAQVRSA